MKKLIQFLGIVFCIAVLVQSCSKDPFVSADDKEPPIYDIRQEIPVGWTPPPYGFSANTLSEAGFRLGRKLFYETRLSRDNTISCGSCHQQFAAFAHSAHSLSHGIGGLLGNRNAPGLFNLAWHPLFMHDGGINHIEVQPMGPITNPVEMDDKISDVVTKLSADAKYPRMFKDAFGDNTITSQRIFRAITQFQGIMLSSNSKYDKYLRGETGGTLTAEETDGMNLFTQKCASCHVPPLFSDFGFRNNGLSTNTTLNDSGRAHITGLAEDRYKFKTPSLRNVEVTGPYMHDGRFKTLEKCLEHYHNGINQTENLAPTLATGIPMTAQEMQHIIAFLKTLTDHQFLLDPRFKDPN